MFLKSAFTFISLGLSSITPLVLFAGNSNRKTEYTWGSFKGSDGECVYDHWGSDGSVKKTLLECKETSKGGVKSIFKFFLFKDHTRTWRTSQGQQATPQVIKLSLTDQGGTLTLDSSSAAIPLLRFNASALNAEVFVQEIKSSSSSKKEETDKIQKEVKDKLNLS